MPRCAAARPARSGPPGCTCRSTTRSRRCAARSPRRARASSSRRWSAALRRRQPRAAPGTALSACPPHPHPLRCHRPMREARGGHATHQFGVAVPR
ncbi:hypothetical protein ACFPRL_10130 [Pseudoclavibacter helvolus]